MKQIAIMLALAAIAFPACGSDESRTPAAVPDPVPNEQALELIRSCRVSLIEGTHSGELYLYLEDDHRVRVEDPSDIWETAGEVSEKCPEMEFATE